uniref:uncharacterized protein LOC122587592 n=1 Tax=Erigeron canadensis TaxID=72917 RepID=UPI001CB95784|nr:uncharacterized protein LOC122587592 [Erigeron canadensis]
MSSDSSSSEDLNYPTSSDESTVSSLQFLLKAHKYLQDTASSSEFRSRQSIDRRRDIGLQTLMNDWFVEEPKYDEAYFRYKFRMDKSMFLSIVDDIEANFPYFQEGYDARGKRSFTAIQKISHRPYDNSQRAMCPMSMTSTYAWPQELHEIQGTTTDSSFSVNGRDYKRDYHLTDGIYNKWATLVKAYPYPTDPKEKKFKRLQEAARKDVERTFGVLKEKMEDSHSTSPAYDQRENWSICLCGVYFALHDHKARWYDDITGSYHGSAGRSSV